MPELSITLSESTVYTFRIGPQDIGEINFRSKSDILLHIKAIRNEGIIVINDYVSGHWRDEKHIKIPSDRLRSPIDVSVEVDTVGATVIALELGSIRIERATDFFDCDVISFSDWFVFSSLQAESNVQSLSQDITALDERYEETLPIVDNSKFRIISAHRHFVEVEVSGIKLTDDDYLIAKVGGYECGVLKVDSITPQESRALRIPMSIPSIIGDAMTVSIALRSNGQETIVTQGQTSLEYYGGLDRCSEQLVRGWAFDPKNPTQPVVVDIYLNDVYQGSAVANRTRNDLGALDPKFKSAGFLFKFPKSIYLPESQDAKVSARPVNTQIELDYSPWYICRRVRFVQEL